MPTVKTPAKVKVFTGGEDIVLDGTVEPLLIEGVQPIYDGAKVQLFHAGRVWWLHYGFDHNTGGFKSKKAAIHWFEHGGR